MNSRIAAIATCYPEKKLGTDEITDSASEALDLERRTGVSTRYRISEHQTTSDMGVAACNKILNSGIINRDKIDFLLFCSETPDYIAPATSCLMQHRLGLKETIFAADIIQGCTGFTHGLIQAKSLIESGTAEAGLIICGDTVSRTIHPDDKELQALFSDGFAAALITAAPEPGIGKIIYGCDGSGGASLGVRNSCFRIEPDTDQSMPHGRLFMDGSAVFHFALKRVPAMIQETIKANNLTQNEINHYIFHQPSAIILDVLQKKMHIAPDAFTRTIKNTGNMVGASLPVAMHYALETGEVSTGDNLVIAAFGVGFSWAATVLNNIDIEVF